MRGRCRLLMLAGFLLSSTPAAASDIKARDVTAPGEIAGRAQDFQRGLAGVGLAGPLKCSVMVEVLNGAGGADQSFGGICRLQLPNRKATMIMLCDDTMIGKLTLKIEGFGEDREELVDFTAANCPAGG